MKKSLFVLFAIIYNLTLFAQTGAHLPSQEVRLAFFSTDGSRCLTISYDDAVLWDYLHKKPIWIKKASELGGFKNLGFLKAVTASGDLTYMIKENPDGANVRAYLFNLNTFQKIGWGWDERTFAADGSIPVVQYMQGKNQNIAYLIHNPFSLEKEKLADKMYKVSINNEDNNLLYIDQEGKNGEPKRYKYYNIAEKKFIPVPSEPKHYYNVELKRWVKKGEEDLKYYRVEIRSYGMSNKERAFTINCKDQDDKVIKEFPLVNTALAYANGYETKPIICKLIHDKNQVKVIEHKNLKDSRTFVLSFLNTYNYLTGELLESMELTNANTDAISVANANNKKADEARAKQYEINNRPENLLKQRINGLLWNGSYTINLKTLRIYKLQPEKGPYQNNMVSLEAITTAGNSQVFELIDNLENKLLYKGIKGYKVCPYCQGKGATQTYKEHEIDQTLSKGRIITETTTYTHGCQSCGGGGVIPN